MTIHQDFLDVDFRKDRDPKVGLPSTDALTLYKHQRLLPKELIQNRRVLDLGSFVGATADWCLNNGCKEYVGVEISKDFYDTSIQLLNQHQLNKPWKIYHQSLQDYFQQHNDHFDIIFAWGLIHHFEDHMWLMREIGQRGNHVIVMGRYPRVMWNSVTNLGSDSFLHDLEYNIPYTEYHNGEMTLLYKNRTSVRCTSANSSMAAVAVPMELMGFRKDTSAHEDFKQQVPDFFGMWYDRVGHYVIEFVRDKKQRYSYEEMHKDPALIDLAQWKSQ
jgi:SAM-dependent methyltransferase